MMRTEDGHIIHECLNGDPAMFGLLVDKYREGIFALAYSKLGNFHDAQDITQEAFLKAYQKLRALRRWDSFALWLSAITNNLCKNFVRSRSARPDREFVEDQSPKAVDASSLDSYRDDQLSEHVREALDSLPEAYRQVLTLHYLGGMKSMDIARLLGVSLRTVTERLRMGREMLKGEMVTIMNATFKRQRLPVGFTFRIVEAVKRTKINPTPRMAGLPWGLSLAVGLIVTVLSLNPNMSILNPASSSAGSALPSEAKALKTGELPVDILKISEISAISSQQGNGNAEETMFPKLQNALLSPQRQGGKWTERADMPTARQGLSTSVVNGKIYAIGGNPNDADFYFATVEEYDPMTDKWTKKTNMPTARTGLSTSAVNGKIYAIGGFAWPQTFSTVEEYDPVTDEWIKKADMPTARAGLSTSVVDGKIYAIGGNGWPQKPQDVPTVEEYDPVTDKWTKKADMPTARSNLGTSVVNGKIYAMGGSGGEVFAIVEEYDPATDTWTEKADMPVPRATFGIGVVDGRIYVIGGYNPQDHCLWPVEGYDPVTDKWTKKADIPTRRAYLSASEVNDKIYAIGGYRVGPSYSTVEEYDPGFRGKRVEAKGKLPTTWGKTKSQ